MRFDIISAVPSLLESPLGQSIVGRAAKNGLIYAQVHDLRDFAKGRYKQIDDYPFGGGAGMVLMPEPLSAAINTLKSERVYDHIVFFSPDGVQLTQSLVNQLSLCTNLMFICGHYKGIDERIRTKYVSMEISVGDFVLSGGEIPAALLVDAITRVLPGAISDETSALSDSFQDGLLAAPVYTRPENFEGQEVPKVLLSGNHAEIDKWRFQQSVERTQSRRPDLFEKSNP